MATTRNPYLKARRHPSEVKTRPDSFGLMYEVEGLPHVRVFASTHRAGNKGSRRTATSYRATVGGRVIAEATMLRTLLLRVERAGFAGFLAVLGAEKLSKGV